MRRIVYYLGRTDADADEMAGPFTYEKLLVQATRRAKKFGSPLRLRNRGKPWGPWWSRLRWRAALAWRTRKGSVGDVWLFQSRGGPTFKVRKARQHIRIRDTAGTDKLDVLITWVLFEFPEVVSWGICNTRPVAGTNSWSYHACCQAWDIHASKATLDRVARYLDEHREDFDIIELLWWTTNHYDHVHVAVGPKMANRTVTGPTPPCAKGG